MANYTSNSSLVKVRDYCRYSKGFRRVCESVVAEIHTEASLLLYAGMSSNEGLIEGEIPHRSAVTKLTVTVSLSDQEEEWQGTTWSVLECNDIVKDFQSDGFSIVV